MRFNLGIGLVAGFLFPASVLAAAIGEPLNTGRWGYSVSASFMSVDDPDGSTEGEWGLHPLTVVYTDHFRGSFRYWLEGFYQEEALSASASDIGQEISRYSVGVGLQARWQKSPGQTWLGAGARISREQYELRHTVHPDGLLLERFPDRDDTNISLFADLTNEWALNNRWDLAGRVLYAFPLDDGIEEFTVQAVFLYSFE